MHFVEGLDLAVAEGLRVVKGSHVVEVVEVVGLAVQKPFRGA